MKVYVFDHVKSIYEQVISALEKILVRFTLDFAKIPMSLFRLDATNCFFESYPQQARII